MVNELAFQITDLLLSLINILIHILSVCLLSKLYTPSPHQLLLLHLSIAEVIASHLRGSISIINLLPKRFMPPPWTPGPPTMAFEVRQYLFMVNITGVFLVMFLLIISLTVDRLLIVLLGVRYKTICSISKAKIVMAHIWCIGISGTLGFVFAYKYYGYDPTYVMEYYVFTSCGIVFMVVSPLWYAVIFWRYHTYKSNMQKYKKTTSAKINDEQEKHVCSSALLDPLFYVPLLIISSFAIFVVIPHWIYLACKYAAKIRYMDPFFAMMILSQLSYLSDAIIYVFLQVRVRKELWRWLKMLWGWLRCNIGCVSARGGEQTLNYRRSTELSSPFV